MNQKIEIQRLVATDGTNRCVSKFAQAIHIHVYGRTFFDNFVYIVDSWLLACCQPHGLEAVVLWVSHTAILGTVAEWPAGQLDKQQRQVAACSLTLRTEVRIYVA